MPLRSIVTVRVRFRSAASAPAPSPDLATNPDIGRRPGAATQPVRQAVSTSTTPRAGRGAQGPGRCPPKHWLESECDASSPPRFGARLAGGALAKRPPRSSANRRLATVPPAGKPPLLRTATYGDIRRSAPHSHPPHPTRPGFDSNHSRDRIAVSTPSAAPS